MIFVDHTHLGRTVTGLERITLELFSPTSLAPLALRPITASGTLGLIFAQQFGVPLRLLAAPGSLLLAPRFPPSIPGARILRARTPPYLPPRLPPHRCPHAGRTGLPWPAVGCR